MVVAVCFCEPICEQSAIKLARYTVYAVELMHTGHDLLYDMNVVKVVANTCLLIVRAFSY